MVIYRSDNNVPLIKNLFDTCTAINVTLKHCNIAINGSYCPPKIILSDIKAPCNIRMPRLREWPHNSIKHLIYCLSDAITIAFYSQPSLAS